LLLCQTAYNLKREGAAERSLLCANGSRRVPYAEFRKQTHPATRWLTVTNVEKVMKKALLTGVALLSLAILPASAQVNSQQQPANGQHVAKQNNSVGVQRNNNRLSRDEIMRAQQALDQKGFDVGKADGIMGARTRQALDRFQQQQKLQQTGQLDQNTLSALGVSQQESTTGQRGNLQSGKAGTNGQPKQPSGMNP
jgi:Putative peptidoglycan binding domain